MPIEPPNLDDKSFAELVREARTALPAMAPEWTDYNPSDPGIALVELLAWLCELLIYRTGRLSERTERAFLGLLSGGVHGGSDERDVASATAKTLRELRARHRAATPDDLTELIDTVWLSSAEAQSLASDRRAIERVHCMPNVNLAAADKTASAPGYLSVIVLPAFGTPWVDAPALLPSFDALLDALRRFVVPRLLVATRLQLVGPTAVSINVQATLALRDDVPAAGQQVRTDAIAALQAHFHPWSGGADGRGWPFGRDLDVSDVYARLDAVPGVEFVESGSVSVSAADSKIGDRSVRESGTLIGVHLEPHELPRIDGANVTLVLEERKNGFWIPIK